MADRYEINIASKHDVRTFGGLGIRYIHFAKVTLPIGTMNADACKALMEFTKRFPASEGWKVTIMEWQERGYECTDQLSKMAAGL